MAAASIKMFSLRNGHVRWRNIPWVLKNSVIALLQSLPDAVLLRSCFGF
ncbi:MAG TPA: hypothetical protein VFJ47_12465 [Terriglobales bacterium]|nr:hypothetical protein [Terriglobales bacterium]